MWAGFDIKMYKYEGYKDIKKLCQIILLYKEIFDTVCRQYCQHISGGQCRITAYFEIVPLKLIVLWL